MNKQEYGRTDLRLNPSRTMEAKFGSDAFKFIEMSYPLKAVHLKGVAGDDQIYVSGKELDYPEIRITGVFEDTTPSAFRRHGSGYLGYVGDTELEHGTQALIVAMLGKSQLYSRWQRSSALEDGLFVESLRGFLFIRRRRDSTFSASNVET